MEPIKKNISKISILLIGIFFVACSTDDVEPSKVNPDASEINEYFSSIPDWEFEKINEIEDTFEYDVDVDGANSDDIYTCPVFQRNLVRTIDRFVSVGTNFGAVWPGAIIQGNSLEGGDLRLMSVSNKRAPITLVTNIALNESTKIVENPNSANVQQTISDFMIAAGEMPEGSQAGAGTLNFQVEEAATFEQSMLQLGVSAGFTDPQTSIGLDGTLNVELNRSSHTHTVAAQFVQEMFTVRVADDLILKPADFFSTDFSMSDLQALENAGEIGSDNIPIYIESVTYGRVMIFSMKSESVSSSNKLSAALEASMAQYANAGGELSAEHEEIFSTASHRVFSAGGTDAAANAAIANLDWSRFFEKSPASTAVPISFTARTISGKQIVGLVNQTSFLKRDNCTLIEIIDPVDPDITSWNVTVEWTTTTNTGACYGDGYFGTCQPTASTKMANEWIFTPLTALNNYKREFIIYPDQETQFSIHSTSRLWVLGSPVTRTETTTFDVLNLTGGNHIREHIFTNFAGSVKLTYRVRVVIHYD